MSKALGLVCVSEWKVGNRTGEKEKGRRKSRTRRRKRKSQVRNWLGCNPQIHTLILPLIRFHPLKVAQPLEAAAGWGISDQELECVGGHFTSKS